jgi:L-threonylcarbamoyladenylate synthase
VDCTSTIPIILRRGSLSKEDIESIVGPVLVGEGKLLDRSPGMRHRHYAPKAKIEIIEEACLDQYSEAIARAKNAGRVIGTMTHSPMLNAVECDVARSVRSSSKEDMAKRLYAEFRIFDGAGATMILVESCDENGIGLALMDRIRRAAEETHKPT